MLPIIHVYVNINLLLLDYEKEDASLNAPWITSEMVSRLWYSWHMDERLPSNRSFG